MKTDNPKILVVDDEYNNFYYIKELLSNFNINVLYASCGIEAFEQCIKNPNIVLILMDIKLKGINGFETALHIKSIRKDIPIIFQTAYAKDFAKDEFMTNIGNGFIEKPFKKDILYSEIEKHTKLNLNKNVNLKKNKTFKLSKIFTSLFY